jgi:hypothetical protein
MNEKIYFFITPGIELAILQLFANPNKNRYGLYIEKQSLL